MPLLDYHFSSDRAIVVTLRSASGTFAKNKIRGFFRGVDENFLLIDESSLSEIPQRIAIAIDLVAMISEVREHSGPASLLRS